MVTQAVTWPAFVLEVNITRNFFCFKCVTFLYKKTVASVCELQGKAKGRRTTNGRRSLKLRLFGFKQSCFPQSVKKEIELGYNVFCAGGIVNSCCRCDGSRRTSRALRTGFASRTFWALGTLWAGCSLRPSCSSLAYRPLGVPAGL